MSIFAARNETCGEICLLATTLKNAKIIYVLCFCDGSAFLWGFCFCII